MATGNSINTYDMNDPLYPLIRARDAPNIVDGFDSSTSAFCSIENSLDRKMVEGKIVICEQKTEGDVVAEAGAFGTIMLVPNLDRFSSLYPLPASLVNLETNGSSGISKNPTATILRSKELSNTQAPYISSFSSRGPNKINPQILKPDLAAQGVDIPPSKVPGDKRIVAFNFLSGTSMACPHATGAAAYVKTFHPLWSAAAIKSALMTTADPMGVNDSNNQNGLAFGSGNTNPLKAIDPGLVYDATVSDYISFLCGIGYDASKLKHITGDNITCAQNQSSTDLNLPSFSVPVPPSTPISVEFYRTVKNVGSPQSKCIAKVVAPPALNIQVEPETLIFPAAGERHSLLR